MLTPPRRIEHPDDAIVKVTVRKLTCGSRRYLTSVGIPACGIMRKRPPHLQRAGRRYQSVRSNLIETATPELMMTS